MFHIKIFPAGNGDALLLKSGEAGATTMLVDGGYAGTFREYIR
jgi:hypothetical protein